MQTEHRPIADPQTSLRASTVGTEVSRSPTELRCETTSNHGRERRSASGSDVFWDQRRRRIIAAMVSTAHEEGYAATSVSSVCARAGVSRQAFYEHFNGREECFSAVLDDGCREVAAVISGAFEGADDWRDAIRLALAELLCFFDANPRLTRVWLVESQAAGVWAVRQRERNIATLTRLIVERWPIPKSVQGQPLASLGVMNAVIGIVQRHVLEDADQPLITLLGPLMGLVATPYLDGRAVGREIRRASIVADTIATRSVPREEPAGNDLALLPATLRDPRAKRARACLRHVAAHPGASNREVAQGAGITGHAQASKLLTRLAHMGLVTKNAPGAPGHPNAWSLTPYGTTTAARLEKY
jgi:AcrR family transcriptional regulator